jgi:hypothetical protein
MRSDKNDASDFQDEKKISDDSTNVNEMGGNSEFDKNSEQRSEKKESVAKQENVEREVSCNIPDYCINYKGNSTIDGELYKREGFHCVIYSNDEARNLLEQKEKEYLNKTNLEHASLEAEYYRIMFVIDEHIVKCKNKLIVEREKLEADKDYLPELEVQIDELKLKLEEKIKLLAEARALFGAKKQKLIEERIFEAKTELALLISNYKAAIAEKQEINTQKYISEKAESDRRANMLDTIIKRYEVQHEKIQKKIAALAESGITENVSGTLLGFGATATVCAGWFFSIYSQNSGFYKLDTVSFLIENLFLFSRKFTSDGGGLVPLLFIGCLFSFIVLTTYTAYISQRIIDYYNSSSTSLNIEIEESKVFKMRMSASNFVSLWLQLVPYIFIGGVLYLILSYGISSPIDNEKSGYSQVHIWSVSISAQITGSGLSFLLAGAAYLYIIFVLEPRLERGTIKSTRANIELVALFTAFTLLIVGLMIYKNDAAPGAIIGFGITSLLTGLLIAYGLRFKGLLNKQDELEQIIYTYGFIRHRLSCPEPVGLEDEEHKLFNSRFLELENELFQLIRMRSSFAIRFWQKNTVRKVETRLSKIITTINRLFKRLGGEKTYKEIDETLDYKEIQERYMPELTDRIKNLKRDTEKLVADLNEVRAKRIAIIHERSANAKRIIGRIRQLEECISNMEVRKANFSGELNEVKRLLDNDYNKIVIYLKEGFDTGIWYQKHLQQPQT